MGLSRRSDNGLPGLDSRRCFVYELLLTREKFYEEADYVWMRTGTGPQSSGHGSRGRRALCRAGGTDASVTVCALGKNKQKIFGVCGPKLANRSACGKS